MRLFSIFILLVSSFNVLGQTNSDFSKNNQGSVLLTVLGQGKTFEDAKYSALRSAIEQAYGAFISSRTEIFNDSLLSNEIVSISNGNINNFEILSKYKTEENVYSLLVRASVSISQLSKFVSNRGYESNFDGQSFAVNIKLQKLNEDAEARAILNSCYITNNILKKSIDFKLENSEPQQIDGENNKFNIKFTVSWITNENYNLFNTYINDLLSKICMSEYDILNYKSLNKEVYNISLFGKIYTFRNIFSIIYLKNLFVQSNQYLHNFRIVFETGEIAPTAKEIFQSWPRQWTYEGLSLPNVDFATPYWGREWYSSWNLYGDLMQNFNKKGFSLFVNNLNFSNEWWAKAMNGIKENWADDIIFENSLDPIIGAIMNRHSTKDYPAGSIKISKYNFSVHYGKWISSKSFSLSELEKIKTFKVTNLN